jgi:hypothetical protein
MRPSLALEGRREEIRRIVAANRGLNPRVFGSALRSEDTDESDLDLPIDPAEGMTLSGLNRAYPWRDGAHRELCLDLASFSRSTLVQDAVIRNFESPANAYSENC